MPNQQVTRSYKAKHLELKVMHSSKSAQSD